MREGWRRMKEGNPFGSTACRIKYTSDWLSIRRDAVASPGRGKMKEWNDGKGGNVWSIVSPAIEEGTTFMNPAFHTGCFFSFLPFFFPRETAFIVVRMDMGCVCNLAFTIFPGRHTLGDCRADWLASKQGMEV